ncbi:MAG: hypothetical protein LUH07_01310 [Lachnospiraceae bacterium]|nr:hypothetical protein [Lachnospiraceae bacterium]
MSITSVSFLLFLTVTFLLFYLCPVRSRWIVLLAASVCFYVLAGAAIFLAFIVFTSAVVWLSSVKIGRLYVEEKQELQADGLDRISKKVIREKYKKKARRMLALTLIVCVGFLCVTKFTKYAVYALNHLMDILNGNMSFSAEWLIIPLGISYYTFSTLGYLLDVYWKRYSYEKNFARFFLYAIYFPHIIQGPISRYNLLGQELKKELRYDSKRIVYGMELMLWGFFKKLVIADRLSIFVSAVYNGEEHAGSVFLVAALFDVFQIYTDFSGYMDIVSGASQIFGVTLEKNFNHPFFSETVPEFWRRWHMTLGGWFKDYVYYPCTISSFMKKLTKKAKNKCSDRIVRFITVVIPVFLTWILTGLWHGTGMTYLCWGLYYGTLITISTAFAPEFQKINEKFRINTDCFSWHLFRKIRTFCCFMGGRLLTSPGSVRYGFVVLKTIIFSFMPISLVDGTMYTYGLNARNFWLAIYCIVILWVVSMMQERFSVREKLSEQNIVFRWTIIYLAIFAILIFGIYGIGYDATEFMYEQF